MARTAVSSSNSLRIFLFSLSVNSTLTNGIGDAVDGQHVGRNPVVDVVGGGEANDVVEGADHDVGELFVDHRLFPEISLAVLDPFKIGRGDAAGAARDVEDHENSAAGEDFGRCGGGW